jgi:PAS domain S-box-containing protein/putative nucleotidyltransferase with HDIG domain
MNQQSILYIGVSSIAAIIVLWIAFFSLRRRGTPGVSYFSLLMLAVAAWTLASAGEVAAATMASKIIWAKFAYLGIVSAPPAWFLFAMGYGQRAHWLTYRRSLVFWMMPAFTFGLVVTNEWHGLIWPSIQSSSEPNAPLVYAHGIGFWTHTVYSYVLLFVGTLSLSWTALRSSVIYRRQAGALIVAALFPWLSNLAYLSDLGVWGGLDTTPLALVITGIVLALGIFRFQVLDLSPIARDVLIEKMNEGVLVLDWRMRIADVNPAASRMIGRSPASVIGRLLSEVLPQCSDLLPRDVGAPGVEAELALSEKMWVQVNISRLDDRRKQSNGYLLQLRDVTHRRTEMVLREAEHRYRDLFENAPVMYVISRNENNAPVIVDCNQLFLRTLGYTLEQVVGRPLADFYTAESRYQMLDQGWFVKSLHGEHVAQERGLVTQDGRAIPTLLRAVPHADKQGNVIGTRAMFLDITDRKRAEAALFQAHQELEQRVQERTVELTQVNQELKLEIADRQQAEDALRVSESFYQSLVEVLPYSLCRKDREGRFTFGNRIFCQSMRVTLADLVGKTDFDLHPPDVARRYQQDDESVMRIGQTLSQTEEHVLREGAKSYVQVVKTPTYDANGNINGVQMLFWDVTEQKRMQDLMRQAHDAMELQMQERTTELAALYELSRSLTATQALDDILKLVVRYAVTTVHVTFARVLLLENNMLSTRFAYPVRTLTDSLESGGAVPLSGLPRCQRILQEGRTVVVRADEPDIVPVEQRLLFQGGAKNLCVVPLRAVERPLGFLILGEERNEKREPFLAEKLNLANSIGDQAASAIRRATLGEQTERRLEYAQALRKVDSAITASLDLNVTLELLLAEAMTQLRADAAMILRLDPYTLTLRCLNTRGLRMVEVEQIPVRLGQEFAGRVAMERQILHVPEIHKSNNPAIQPLLRALGDLDHYVGAPLIAKGQVEGVLEVFARTPFALDLDWYALLESFALQAAIAMDNHELFRNLQRSNSELSIAYEATIEGWSHALDLRDKETEGHSQRVTELTVQLARAMGVNEQELGHIRRGALLHDIGKMGVPDAILLKPGSLTPEERAVMQNHTRYAYEMLYPIDYLRPALAISYCHHEKWDGTGYPRGLKGEEIPLAARIFTVVDVWDALTSDRPYRAAWTNFQACDYITSRAGTEFDPQVVQVFLKIVRDTRTGAI